jgi:myosin heavy subunit
MEDSSEVLTSPGNSNLKDMIMQKLSAAREQKLKQNKSFSNLSNSSKISPSIVVNSSWEEEKQLLLSMLEKSQTSATQSNYERRQLDAQIVLLNNETKKLLKENKELKTELERLWNKKPEDRTESILVEQLRKLENLADQREKQYKDEIAALKDQISIKTDNKEGVLKNEIYMLEQKINAYEENIKDKDKELEKLKKSLKNIKPTNNNNLLNEIKSEKEKLERNLDRTIKMSCEKESQLSDEIVKLKTLNSQLTDQKEQKEKELKDQQATLSQEILSLKKKLFEYGKKATEEKSILEKEKSSILTALEALKNDVKQSEVFSTIIALKNDLQRANETISQQNAMIEQLKEEAMHSLDIVPTKEKTSDLKQIVFSLQKEFSDYSQKLKASEDLHIGELLQKNNEITSLQTEISELRHKLIVFEGKKYENELMLIRGDLHKAIAERTHAKKLIISYIRSVQQLEKMLNDRQDPGGIPEMHRQQLSRLNEENNSLIESKKKQEEFYQNEIKYLESVIETQTGKIQELENKIDLNTKVKVKESTDEMKSWIVKNKQLQEINKRLVDTVSSYEIKNTQTGTKKNTQYAKFNEPRSSFKSV